MSALQSAPHAWPGLLAAALALALAAPVLRAAEPAVTIELPAQVEVAQSPVRLGEVARMTTRDLPLLRRLMALPLGSAPRGGQSVPLQREALQHWVRRHVALAADEILWTGAGETRVVGRPAQRAVAPGAARGSWATLELRQGAVVLESRAEVLEDARADGLVRVRRAGSAESLLARVAGPGRLEVAP